MPVKFYPDPLRFAGVMSHIIPSRYTEFVCTGGSYADKNIKLLLILSKHILRCRTIRYFTAVRKVTTSKFTAKMFYLSLEHEIRNLWSPGHSLGLHVR